MNVLKEARLRKMMTQKQLAEELNTSQSNINGWENNRLFPKATMLAKLMDIIGRSNVHKYLEELREK